MLQCRIRPMPQYVQHTLGRFQFLRDARSADDTRASGKVSRENPDGLIIVDPDRDILVDAKVRADVDEAGKPLVITEASYAMLKQVAGVSLVIEPLNDPDEAAKVEALAKKFSDARVRAAEEEAEKIKKVAAAEKRTLEDALTEARAKIAEYESAVASVGKKR